MTRRSWPERLLGIQGAWPRATSRTQEHLDAGIGFVIFWALILAIVTVVQQVTGGVAVPWALALAASVVLTALLIRLRYRLARQR